MKISTAKPPSEKPGDRLEGIEKVMCVFGDLPNGKFSLNNNHVGENQTYNEMDDKWYKCIGLTIQIVIQHVCSCEVYVLNKKGPNLTSVLSINKSCQLCGCREVVFFGAQQDVLFTLAQQGKLAGTARQLNQDIVNF
ncbi:hypothetical protein F2P81_007042 [Scophthalmus maximus]|uniref:Uncharacterized protein n=1 Tax=Scophthalmus maximus TaxID=52904 RepID=A0A6A4TD88_SCOMX|nr:hypothetical protein F2P81_007042 [Scophthalmus maximus]